MITDSQVGARPNPATHTGTRWNTTGYDISRRAYYSRLPTFTPQPYLHLPMFTPLEGFSPPILLSANRIKEFIPSIIPSFNPLPII